MKKICTLFLLVAIIGYPVFSQEVNPEPAKKKARLSLDFSGAYSIPVGKYKAVDHDQEHSGYAAGGFLAQVRLNWMGRKNIGLGISYAFQMNNLQDTAKHVTPSGTDTSFVLGTDPWMNHYVLAGPVFQKEFGRWVLDVAVLGGFIISQSSNFTMTVPLDSMSYRLSEGAGTGIAVQGKISAGYRISNRVMLTAGFSYLGGTPVRKKENYIFAGYVEDPPGSNYYTPVFQGYEEIRKKPVSTINAGIGIIVKL